MPKKQPTRANGKESATRTKARPELQAVDWVAVLKSGPAGVRKWNRLTRAGREDVKLSGVDLSGADLSEANFSATAAEKASFARCVLSQARLTSGTFDGADFAGANLAGADLSSSRCHRTSFAAADLTGADLSQADLPGADLTGATLADATLAGARFDQDTKWPEGFVVPADMAWSGRGTDPRLSGKGKNAVAADINGLMTRLNAVIDPKRMKRTLDMLKTGKNQLFAEIEPKLIRGIVRSQKEEDLVYSCVLTEEGIYTCCTPDLNLCMGLRGEPCKHLLVLLIGLAHAGRLDPATIDRWLLAAIGKNHRWNKTTQNHVSDTLLKYQGVQTGEIDWRPTETIPEDFYAM
jgi:pentapeptide repeat protein